MHKKSYMDLDKLVKEKEKLWAHTKEGRSPELLEEHLERTLGYFEWICKEKKLDRVLSNLSNAFGNCKILKELLRDMIYLHDIGKVNVDFQIKKMQNTQIDGKSKGDGHHSMFSAYVYMDYSYQKLKTLNLSNEIDNEYALLLIYLNAYVISRHHSPLSSLDEFNKEIIKFIRDNKLDTQKSNANKMQLIRYLNYELTLDLGYVEGAVEELLEVFIKDYFKGWDNAIIMIYTKIAYSVLVTCDFYATSEYMNNDKIQDIGVIRNPHDWEIAYKNTEVYKAIQRYSERRIDFDKIDSINQLRSKMFLEANRELEENIDKYIYYLEAPTGGGKTNISIWLMLQIMKKQEVSRKVYYVFPFNTLAEQTHKTLEGIFDGNQDIAREIAVINGLTEYKVKDELDENDEADYDKILLDRQFGHYGLILTSHVQFFMWLFGSKREYAGGLYQLANSVVILDEIQVYKNSIWTEIIGFLEKYAELLNIKVIIMSATLPAIGDLIDKVTDIPRLLPRAKQYFAHPLFKHRVTLDFSLLEEEQPTQKIAQYIQSYNKYSSYRILIEFITKKSAMEFYIELCELKEKGCINKPIYLITGDDSRPIREDIINKIKMAQTNKSGIIVVATQIIESGVDIDMNIGFKDISILDSEEQFLGRINRSCKEENAKAYFFNLDRANMIYKNDHRKNKEYTLLEKKNQCILIEKDFISFYKEILQDVKMYVNRANDDNIEQFLDNEVRIADAKAIQNRMKLIDEDMYPVSVFINHSSTCKWDGKEVWQEYVELYTNNKIPYPERKVRIAKLREEMDCFIWKVKKQSGLSYTDKVGDMLYIEDGDKYFMNGKLDRKQLTGDTFELL